ncbi:MAG: hypothetical protein AB7P03_25570 [Kofleriaceae bacterium]
MIVRALVLVTVAGCIPPLTRPPENVVDLAYRTATPARSTATALYRWAGSRSLGLAPRCKMMPSDSTMFALRAESCGGIAAWYWGVARVLLEQGGSPKFLAPLRVEDRLRWVDLPGPCR